jgi:phosphoglycerate kinase
MAKKTIDDVSLKGKKVLMRCDFNVPLNEDRRITDDRRIVASLPSIEKVISSEGALILCSHLGRPKGEVNPKMSLKPVADRLSELLGKKVTLAGDCIGDEVRKLRSSLKPGEVLLLENLRFHKQEEKNDPDFARELAEGADVFVNDAFGTAHRAHASTEGVTKYIAESVAGYLIEKELQYLGEAINAPKRPLLAILGGAKISGKIDVIMNLLEKVDGLIIGGGMVFTFYKSQGMEIGKSLLEEDRIGMADEILKLAREKHRKILLPVDVVVADAFENTANKKVVDIGEIPAGWMGLDIGPKSIQMFTEEIGSAQTIIWNGPMGAFEMDNFATGTKEIAAALAAATKRGAITVVGGGDSAAAIAQFGLEEQITHISTGGGASLEFLEGRELPGIAALADK